MLRRERREKQSDSQIERAWRIHHVMSTRKLSLAHGFYGAAGIWTRRRPFDLRSVTARCPLFRIICLNVSAGFLQRTHIVAAKVMQWSTTRTRSPTPGSRLFRKSSTGPTAMSGFSPFGNRASPFFVFHRASTAWQAPMWTDYC